MFLKGFLASLVLVFCSVHAFHRPSRISMTNSDIQFTKYQGLGNDFILIDNTKHSTPIYTPEQATKILNRNFGVGGDGVIFAMAGTNGCDYTMRIYNSDGSEPEMCGMAYQTFFLLLYERISHALSPAFYVEFSNHLNLPDSIFLPGNGIRCMARFLLEVEGKGSFSEETYTISTGAGKIIPKICKDGTVTVDMGEPILCPPEEIPTTISATQDGKVVEAEIEASGVKYRINCVSMGNPHGVIFIDDLDSMDPPFSSVGPVIENHPAFPERVNAEFAQVISPSHIRMKVWERGAGPTLACGTGACATCVAGVLSGRTERKATVSLPGGDLIIEWRESDNKIFMTGPAEAVFRGTLPSMP